MRSLAAATLVALAAGSVFAAPTRMVRVQEVLAGSLPADLTAPEGKSRWHLEDVTLGASHTIRFDLESSGVRVSDGLEGSDAAPVTFTYRDDSVAGDAERYVLPDRAHLALGDRAVWKLVESRDGRDGRLFVDVEAVGIGWVHLPSGPREVVLQRVSVLREAAGTSGFAPDRFGWRWVDPRAGVVAEVSGPATADGRSATTLDRGTVLQEVVTGAADLKLYSNEVYKGDNIDLNWGWDRGAVNVSTLTTPSYSTIGALINANTWDFSGNTSGLDVAQIQTPLNSTESCNTASCGYNGAGTSLGRQDKYSGTTFNRSDNQVTWQENRATDVTVWVKAGAQKEGQPGAFGTGETRFCYSTEGGKTRNPVPLYRFAHQDAGGWYMTSGDSFSGGPGGSCQQTLFNGVCGDTSGTCAVIYAKSCSLGGGHAGTQGGAVLKGGVVTIPSGHTLNVLLVRTVGDFCTYCDSFCILPVQEVRTVVYTWQAPWIGTVVLLQSPINAPDFTSWSAVDNTIISYGLLPPLSITAGAATDSTVSLSWDPGHDTHRISRYKIYWDTDSGASTSYAFNSETNPGQVSFSGTTATISGLTPGTNYYFTVTSVYDHTDPTRPDTGDITRSYESIKYPTQAAGDPDKIYPIEVQKATTGGTCIPTAEVTGLTVNKTLNPGEIQICWNPVSDACLQGYDVLGADTPSSAAGFSTVGQVGATTCWLGTPPTQKYFLVVARGTGGNGPWGHYGQ